MKKAVVIGRSNGIGLSLSINLIENGYYILILDVVKPDQGIIHDYDYKYYDLRFFDSVLF